MRVLVTRLPFAPPPSLYMRCRTMKLEGSVVPLLSATCVVHNVLPLAQYGQ